MKMALVVLLRCPGYISKYIAKPKDFSARGLPKELLKPRGDCPASIFGKSSIPYHNLKAYYQCVDLRNLPFQERVDRIIERSKTLTVNGVKFPFPRRLKEEIFYKKVKQDDGSIRLEKSPLQRLVVARERVRVVEKFERLTRKSLL